jgi:hypothetical protein
MGPLIFIATNRLKPGRLDSERARVPGLVEFIEANEPVSLDCQPIASGLREGFWVRQVAGSEQGTVPGPARAHGSSVRRPL